MRDPNDKPDETHRQQRKRGLRKAENAVPDNDRPDNDSEPEGALDMDSPEDRRTLRTAIAASAMGNATEWFDYGVFAVVTVYIGHNFFPGDNEAVMTLLTYAISFLLRPLGGMIWGPLGDRLGRKAILATTILLMSGATFAIGLLPTHSSVGVLAPILLIALRVIQGFSTGGEYGGAATFMAEYAPRRRRGALGSFLEFGTLIGLVAGSSLVLLFQLIFSETQMMDWGWRLPFLVAGPLGLVGWYLRSKLAEPPVFAEVNDKADDAVSGSVWNKLSALVRDYRKPLLTMAGMVIALNVVNYLLLTYTPTYLNTTIGMKESNTTALVLIGQLVMMACLPFLGRLSDRVGRKPMWWFSLIGIFVVAIPVYWAMGQGFTWALVGFAVLGLLYLPQLATISATFPAMFPTQVRYAGFALSYNVATAAFGGTAPLVNEGLIKATGNNLIPAFYTMGACLIGMIAMKFYQETAGVSLRGTEIPGESMSDEEVAAARV